MAKKAAAAYSKKKSLALRIFILAIAAAMLLGIIIMPLASNMA